MKKLTRAVGVVVVAMAATPSQAKTSADGIAPDGSEIKGQAAESADEHQVRPSEQFAQYYTSRRFLRGRGVSSEPYVKDEHPKGPTWVNSPHGVQDRLNPVVNPAFRNIYKKRQSY
ncbi:hypothetical protein [Methylocystis silviterrae]|uniref:hypothetical protein n=1 Tax=Methylocystis silviterrae TaxID=2743612 RepID=UPI003C75BE26